MYEIELKAHVYNRDELICKLNADARYLGTAEKTDGYWRQSVPVRNDAIGANGKAGTARPDDVNVKTGTEQPDKKAAFPKAAAEKACPAEKMPAEKNAENPLTVRIRTECTETAANEKKRRCLVTYKQKRRDCKENAALEVNDEKEFAVSDRTEFERFLHKAGFEAVFEKRKKSMQWKKDGVLIELCTVEPLGDFLEMEILAETADENRINEARLTLEKLLKKYGIPLEQIEPMYYSELLKAKKFFGSRSFLQNFL